MQEYLGEAGLFEQEVTGFRIRPTQLAMAECLQEAFRHKTSQIIEAGTGTGKTYAYLVPALLQEGKTIISTATIALQNQLFEIDIPLVLRVLKVPSEVRLLKGRGHYLCHHRLMDPELSQKNLKEDEWLDLQMLRSFAQNDSSGEWTGLPLRSSRAALSPSVSSTRENCLGQSCSYVSQCFVSAARKLAMQADVIVVNHHILLADLMLKECGMGELLPLVARVVVDEAHKFADIATDFLGETLNTAQLMNWTQDTYLTAQNIYHANPKVLQKVQVIKQCLLDFQLTIHTHQEALSAHQLQSNDAFRAGLEQLAVLLNDLKSDLILAGDSNPDFIPLAQKATAWLSVLNDWLERKEEGSKNKILWAMASDKGIELKTAPLLVGDRLQSQWRLDQQSWVFISATLSVNGDFAHFKETLGLSQVLAQRWESPFDFSSQGLLFLPSDLCSIKSSQYDDQWLQVVQSLLQASQGRAFILFTSHQQLRKMALRLRQLKQLGNFSFPLLVQGEQRDSQSLLQTFRQLSNGILLGTQSFWEGVDVKGPNLSLVIIERLPFESPTDPIVLARKHHLEELGKNAFKDYVLPRALMNLCQGAGRLIRDESDHGVLVITDSRAWKSSFRKAVISSLPPFRQTHSLETVQQFLRNC